MIRMRGTIGCAITDLRNRLVPVHAELILDVDSSVSDMARLRSRRDILMQEKMKE